GRHHLYRGCRPSLEFGIRGLRLARSCQRGTGGAFSFGRAPPVSGITVPPGGSPILHPPSRTRTLFLYKIAPVWYTHGYIAGNDVGMHVPSVFACRVA